MPAVAAVRERAVRKLLVVVERWGVARLSYHIPYDCGIYRNGTARDFTTSGQVHMMELQLHEL